MRRTPNVPLDAFVAAAGRGLLDAQCALDESAAGRFRFGALTLRMPVRIDGSLRVGAARRAAARLAFTFRWREGEQR